MEESCEHDRRVAGPFPSCAARVFTPVDIYATTRELPPSLAEERLRFGWGRDPVSTVAYLPPPGLQRTLLCSALRNSKRMTRTRWCWTGHGRAGRMQSAGRCRDGHLAACNGFRNALQMQQCEARAVNGQTGAGAQRMGGAAYLHGQVLPPPPPKMKMRWCVCVWVYLR
jgi:hypothetical protein